MFARRLQNAKDIVYGVLSVRVRRYDAARAVPLVEDGIDAGFQRAAFPKVDGVTQHDTTQCHDLVKERAIRLAASVIHNPGFTSRVSKFPAQRNQTPRGLIRGNQYDHFFIHSL